MIAALEELKRVHEPLPSQQFLRLRESPAAGVASRACS